MDSGAGTDPADVRRGYGAVMAILFAVMATFDQWAGWLAGIGALL